VATTATGTPTQEIRHRGAAPQQQPPQLLRSAAI